MKKYIYILVAISVLVATQAQGQNKYPERKFIREGNKEYEKGEYTQSELEYRRAIEKTPDSYPAAYNLASSMYKQGRFEEAAQMFAKLAEHPDTLESAHNHYNAGNSLFEAGKLKEALEEYKSSLRKNPDDKEAKYNLAYTKKMLEQQDEDKQDDKDNKDDNKDNEDNKDDNKDNEDNKDDKPDDNQEPPPAKPDSQKSSMSKEEAERLLEAMQMNEDKTREKMNEEQAVGVASSGKNW